MKTYIATFVTVLLLSLSLNLWSQNTNYQLEVSSILPWPAIHHTEGDLEAFEYEHANIELTLNRAGHHFAEFALKSPHQIPESMRFIVGINHHGQLTQIKLLHAEESIFCQDFLNYLTQTLWCNPAKMNGESVDSQYICKMLINSKTEQN